MVQRGETRRMSEDNGLITHTTTSPHLENQRATENKAMVITSLDLILCTLKGNWYNLILVLCKITLDLDLLFHCLKLMSCKFSTSEKKVFMHIFLKHISAIQPQIKHKQMDYQPCRNSNNRNTAMNWAVWTGAGFLKILICSAHTDVWWPLWTA